MKKIVSIFVLTVMCASATYAQRANEVALVMVPLKLDVQESYSLLYRRALPKNNWMLRGTLGLGVDFDKETRSDSVSSNTGNISYDLSVGIQKNLSLGDWENVTAYVATGVYYNSAFIRRASDTYYGYFWNTGLRPLTGVSYQPLSNIRLSIEARSDFNLNFQEYSAPGENKDARVSFLPMNEIVLGIGYLF